MGILLYSHNEQAYRAALSMLAETGKAAVVHPTGTGKSFIGFKLCEDNPEKTVLWLSPSEYIFKTQIENLKAAGGTPPKNITFATYQKFSMYTEAEIASLQVDRLVLDEFHRCGAQIWQENILKFLNLFSGVPVLGLSATAIRYLDNQRDMAEELFDGNVASEMTLGEAIVRGILNPPKYVLSVFSYQKDLEKYERRVKSARSRAVRDAAEKYLEALRRALEKADGLDVIFDKHMTDRTGKYIVFCANKEHMDEMMEKSGEWFAKVDTAPHIYSVYSDDPGATKSFDDFKADDDDTHLRLLYCIDALNEGIHVEDVSGVILLRPTVSPIIYKQQIGRALSASKKNDAVIFDVVMNIENLYSIGEVEDEMRLATAYYRSVGEEEQIVNEQFRVIDELHDCMELFDRLNDTLTASWDIMYGYAKEYFEKHGNLETTNGYRTEDGYSLGRWLHRQRGIRNGTVNGNLTERQIERLDAIGMVWGGLLDLRWERNFEAAKRYFAENGDLNVPASYVTADGVNLGKWLSSLRSWEKMGAHSSYLTAERKRSLEEIGMVWDMLDFFWERNYFAACAFYKEHGHLYVPSKYVSKDGVRLGAWIANLKKLRNGSQLRGTPLTERQIERLNAIGMDWRTQSEISWETAYTEAVKYARTHRDLLVPAKYVAKSGFNLGVWIQKQRQMLRQGKLSEERKRRLDEIGMAWRTSDPWMERYEAVKRYHAEHGTLDIPRTCVVGDLWIGKWFFHQKKAYFAGQLDPEKRKLFSELPLGDLPCASRWERVYADLKEYYDATGSLNVPKSYTGKSGTNLGTWMLTQRRKRRRGELSERQIEALDRLGFSWEQQVGWENGYRHAKAYFEENGNLDLPYKYVCDDGFRLGAWVFKRRKERLERSDALSAEQVEALNQIGMNWDDRGRWDRNYDLAMEYVRTHGSHPRKETAVTEEERGIAAWLNSQRTCFRDGRLSPDRIEKLKRLSPEIVAERVPPFENGCRHAKAYFDEHGDLNVPSGYRCEDGYRLGSWLKRQQRKRAELTPEQVERLDGLGMVWEQKDSWHCQLEKAERFYRDNGYLPNYPSLCRDKEETNLYQWLKNQRRRAKDGELSEEQIQMLSSVGMDWRNATDRAWERGFASANTQRL